MKHKGKNCFNEEDIFNEDGSPHRRDLFKYAADAHELQEAIRLSLDQLGRSPKAYSTIAVNNARAILNEAYTKFRAKYSRTEQVPLD